MMINKRLIGMVSESKRYIAGNVVFQWIALTVNIAMMAAITGLLAGLFERTADGRSVLYTLLTAAVAVAVRYICTRLSARMSYLSSKAVKKTLRSQIYQKLLRLGAAYNEKVRTSEIVQVAVEGVDQLETYFGAYLPQFFYAMLAPLTLFAVLSFVNFPCAVVLLICVPLILEKIYRKQVLPLLEKGPMSIAMKIPLLNSAIYSAIRKKLIDSFGGEVVIFIVGGAPMNQETEAFLLKIKFPITVGYGMTECAPLISFTTDDLFKAGSCGMYIKEYLDLRIDSPDPEHTAGEIIVKGEHVMLGYYKDPEATAEVLDAEGWFHTGDLARVDEDGYYFLTGRKKNVIILGSGENVSPEELEGLLEKCPAVKECLVKEKGKKICAVIYCEEAKQEEVREYITATNRTLPLYQRMSAVEFSTEPLPRTGTGKLLRK